MLKYSELYDYILGVLYTLKRRKHTGFYSLAEIIKNLDYPANPSEIFDIGKYLEAEGYVKANFSLGDVFVEITPNGIVHIENKSESFLPTFEQFLEQKKTEKKVERIATKLSKTAVKNSRRPIISQVDKVIEYLNSVKSFKNSDIYYDARILKLELQKEKPDREVLLIKVENFNRYPEISNVAFELRNYIIHYAEDF